MTRVIAWTVVALFGALVVTDAYALTLKTGEVLSSSGKVMKAHETENAKKQLESKGYIVSGGILALDVAGEAVVVKISEIRGKTKEAIKEIIGEAAAEVFEDKVESINSYEEAVEALGKEAADEIQAAYEEATDSISFEEAIEQYGHDNIHDYLSSPDSSEAAHQGWNEAAQNAKEFLENNPLDGDIYQLMKDDKINHVQAAQMQAERNG